MSSSSLLTVRRVILTAGIAGTAATGAILGAQLKENKQVVERIEEIKKASPDEIIATIESRIHELEHMRAGILAKINDLDRRIELKSKAAGTTDG